MLVVTVHSGVGSDEKKGIREPCTRARGGRICYLRSRGGREISTSDTCDEEGDEGAWVERRVRHFNNVLDASVPENASSHNNVSYTLNCLQVGKIKK